jgi:sensor histidine kinase regulating citrate/malate metabolism
MAKDNSQNMQELFLFLVYAIVFVITCFTVIFFLKNYQRKTDERRDTLVNVARV